MSEFTSEQRAHEILRLRQGLTEKSSELDQRMKDLEYMTNLSDGRLNRIKELLECKGALRETEKALNEKLTQSLDQITNLEEKAAFFESLSLERAADLEKLKVDTEMLAGNFENLVDYIRRLKEELASHGHELIEGPVINLPESAQSA